MNPWDVHRTTPFVACAEHCLVDTHVGLLIGRRADLAWVLWVDAGEVRQEWVEVERVQVARPVAGGFEPTYRAHYRLVP